MLTPGSKSDIIITVDKNCGAEIHREDLNNEQTTFVIIQ